jgi:hypothetical protein
MGSERQTESQTDAGRPVRDRLEETKVSAGKHGRWFYLAWVVVWIVLLTLMLVIYASFF